jgi:hypothetical protein
LKKLLPKKWRSKNFHTIKTLDFVYLSRNFKKLLSKKWRSKKKHSTRALLDDASSWHEHLPQATESPCHAQLTTPTIRDKLMPFPGQKHTHTQIKNDLKS